MLKSQRKSSSCPSQRQLKPSGPNGHGTAALARVPRRPITTLLSEAIPLFFIGRNKNGLWVAREENGRIGGIFLLKRSALRFAHDSTPPLGCATMEVPEGLELDIHNSGNPLIAWIAATVRRLYRHIEPRLGQA